MKLKLIGLVYGCCLAIFADAQELRQTGYYMQLPNVSAAAKNYHSGSLSAGDNDVTYSIADSMNTENDDTRPFYIFLVSKMLLNADKQLALRLGSYCRYFMQNNPDAAIVLLFSKTVKPVYKLKWAKVIAEDIDANCETTVLQCYKTARTLALERCAEENKPRLEIIFNQVRSDLNISGH